MMINNNTNSNIIKNEDELIKAWDKIVKIFFIPSHNELLNKQQINLDNNNNNDLKQLFNIIKFNKLDSLVIDWYFESIKKYFKNILSIEFWKFFNNVDLQDLVDSLNNTTTNGKQLKFINNQFTLSINLLHKIFSYFKSNLLIFYKYLYKEDKFYNFNFLIKKLQDLLITNIMYISIEKTKYFNTILFMFFERDFISFTKSFYFSKKQNMILNKQEDNEEEEEELNESSSTSFLMEMSFEDSITDINIKEDSFMDICRKLQDLNFIVISEEIFTQILFKKIFEYIESKCKGIFEKRFLKSILEWADQVIFKWLSMILLLSSSSTSFFKNNGGVISSGNSNEESIKIFNQWKTRLEFSIYENYSQQRISELFDMIVQYPDSVPSLEDLSICFKKIPIEKTMISNLKKVLHSRLLHPGANTSDIITQYISTIHSMNIIDPSGIVMEKVGKPIREYLSQREDTIRCIISSFTDESNEIYNEFCNYENENENDHGSGEIKDATNGGGGGGGDLYIDEGDLFNEDDYKWFINSNSSSCNYTEDGSIIMMMNKNKNKKKKDTISHLVNIYDGIDLFINEYRSMLSDRLLSVNDYDLDKEIKNVELLKLRFGDSALFNCEIMIKDMTDSKRLNQQIKSTVSATTNELNEFETLILSQLFWPTLKGDEFKYPFRIQNKMQMYSKEYERIKTPRQLIWKQHLGLVDLDLEFSAGNIQSFQVSPIHATIIMLFESDNDDDDNEELELSLDYLSNQLEISKELVKKKLVFWINNQIIKESNFEKYKINNKQQQQQQQQNDKKQDEEEEDDDDDSSDTDDEDDNNIVVIEEEEEKSTSEKEKEEQMRVVESFIIGMLTNFKALPLERIHSMLSMFNAEVYTSTIQELKSFLTKLSNEEKIELSNNNDYKIKK